MGNIAIITARGGSKRIPKKNIKYFCGRPIITYSIEAALSSGVFDRVMVSTDSQDIADISRENGAVVPFLRSAETSNDFATTADVITEVLEQYSLQGEKFDAFACIYPTAPFLTGEKLSKAMALLSDADAVVPVVKYSFPPQRAFVIRNGMVNYQYPEYERARSQDLEPIYHDCGQFYICKCREFLNKHSLILPRTMPFVMAEEEVQDIDTISDWEIAELKYQILNNNNKG